MKSELKGVGSKFRVRHFIELPGLETAPGMQQVLNKLTDNASKMRTVKPFPVVMDLGQETCG